MEELVLNNEPLFRGVAAGGLLALFVLLEVLRPRRTRRFTRMRRWPVNLAIVVIDVLVLRVAVTLVAVGAAVGAAIWAQAEGIGLFVLIDLPYWVVVPASVLLLDCAIYWQHRLFHEIPLFWRMHRMHHCDPDFDVTTALRFHPLEILLSMAIKIVLVVALGAPALAVVLFEVLLNGAAMFNHANARLPAGLDRVLRLVLVTPDMHRVHHSVRPEETNSNYGFNLPWWDRLFGSYRAQPRDGHEGMTIGLTAYPDDKPTRLLWLLALPFLPLETVPAGMEKDEKR